MFISNELILVNTKEILSKNGSEFKLFTLIDTANNYNKLTLLGSLDIPEVADHSKVIIEISISPRQKGYSIFVNSLRLA
jgi:hypothetical protein